MNEVPTVLAIPVSLVGRCAIVAVTSGALIIHGWLGAQPGSTTTGPPANDRPPQKA